MAVIIGGFKQETNSFCYVKMAIEDFKKGYLYCDDKILKNLEGSKTGEGGFIDVLKKENKEIIPTLSAMPASSSGGVATAETYHYLRDGLLDRIKKINESDTEVEAVLLNMHGAMIAEDCDDVEGCVVDAVRSIVGKKYLLEWLLTGMLMFLISSWPMLIL